MHHTTIVPKTEKITNISSINKLVIYNHRSTKTISTLIVVNGQRHDRYKNFKQNHNENGFIINESDSIFAFTKSKSFTDGEHITV